MDFVTLLVFELYFEVQKYLVFISNPNLTKFSILDTNIIDEPKESILYILGIFEKNEEIQATLYSIGENKGFLEFL